MKQGVAFRSALLGIGVLALGAAAWAGGGKWVSKDGHRIEFQGRDAMALEGGTEVYLDELADGETRVFGSGERQVTASRRGDEITVSRAAVSGKTPLDMTCTVGRDECKVVTFADDPEKVMVVLQKRLTCENGVGDCEDVDVIALGHGPHGEAHFVREFGGEGGPHVVRIHKTVECDDDGNCAEAEALMEGGGLAEIVIEQLGDGAAAAEGANVFVLRGGDGRITLRCEEGDTTMRVKAEEADDVYLCPKHSTPLEKVEAPTRTQRRMKVRHAGH